MCSGSLRDTWYYFSPTVSVTLGGERPGHPLKGEWHPRLSFRTLGGGGGDAGTQVYMGEFPTQSCDTLLLHPDVNLGEVKAVQQGAGGLREGSVRSWAGERASSQHRSLSFL